MVRILYKIHPKRSIDKPEYNGNSMREFNECALIPICNPEFQEIPIDFTCHVGGFDGHTLTCADLSTLLADAVAVIQKHKKSSKMIDMSATAAAYAWAYNRLATEDRLCTVDLVITFKFQR